MKNDARAQTLEIAGMLLAGEIRVIEGCRALSSLRWSFGADMEKFFLPFVAIGSETDALPTGFSVRLQWDCDALAKKDFEIARSEDRYRAMATQACEQIIERLRSDPAF